MAADFKGSGNIGVEGRGVKHGGKGQASGGASTGVRVLGPQARGGTFSGKDAQLKLKPSKWATHPARGQRGDFSVDKSGRIWFCGCNTNWKRLAKLSSAAPAPTLWSA